MSVEELRHKQPQLKQKTRISKTFQSDHSESTSTSQSDSPIFQTRDVLPSSESDDFHLTVEIPGKKKSSSHTDLPIMEEKNSYYLEIPSIHYQNDFRDEYEIETYADLDEESIDVNQTSSPDSGKDTIPTVILPGTKKQEPTILFADEHSHPTIDEVIGQHICNEPFLSENELYSLLKHETFSNFKLTRQSLRKRLVTKGLETGYKRFLAYISG
ncbi:MAG: hypothetical protein JW863_10325 [Chitinispirillaceae bacterium]|nr:hypothetical protein [Chitinispirillaceae bacterium]